MPDPMARASVESVKGHGSCLMRRPHDKSDLAISAWLRRTTRTNGGHRPTGGSTCGISLPERSPPLEVGLHRFGETRRPLRNIGNEKSR